MGHQAAAQGRKTGLADHVVLQHMTGSGEAHGGRPRLHHSRSNTFESDLDSIYPCGD